MVAPQAAERLEKGSKKRPDPMRVVENHDVIWRQRQLQKGGGASALVRMAPRKRRLFRACADQHACHEGVMKVGRLSLPFGILQDQSCCADPLTCRSLAGLAGVVSAQGARSHHRRHGMLPV